MTERIIYQIDLSDDDIDALWSAVYELSPGTPGHFALAQLLQCVADAMPDEDEDEDE